MQMENSENPNEGKKQSNGKAFFFGLASGVVSGLVLSGMWRPLAKGGIKTGTKGWRKVKEVSQKALEDIQDVAAEAADELAQEETRER